MTLILVSIMAMIYGLIATKLGHSGDLMFWTGLLYGTAIQLIYMFAGNR